MYEEIAELLMQEGVLSEKERNIFDDKMQIVNKLGFKELIENIATNKGKRLDFITELNVITQLYKELVDNGKEFKMYYEPELCAGSPDLKVSMDGINYWIQIKRINTTKTENINNKVLNRIDTLLRNINVGLFYRVHYTNHLNFGDAEKFYQKLNESLAMIKSGNKLVYNFNDDKMTFIYADVQDEYYIKESEKEISIEFLSPSKKKLQNLTRSISCDFVHEISDEVNEHIRGSIKKALKSIGWKKDAHNINLIFADPHTFLNLSPSDHSVH